MDFKKHLTPLEQIHFSAISYARMAAELHPSSGARIDAIRSRYKDKQNLLQGDIEQARTVIEMFEGWLEKDKGHAKDFAVKYLPRVREFREDLLAYDWGTADAEARKEYGAGLAVQR